MYIYELQNTRIIATKFAFDRNKFVILNFFKEKNSSKILKTEKSYHSEGTRQGF